ncbi:MAG: hypothetical protein ABL998_22300 [Planctomycetota bacterium]
MTLYQELSDHAGRAARAFLEEKEAGRAIALRLKGKVEAYLEAPSGKIRFARLDADSNVVGEPADDPDPTQSGSGAWNVGLHVELGCEGFWSLLVLKLSINAKASEVVLRTRHRICIADETSWDSLVREVESSIRSALDVPGSEPTFGFNVR